MRFVSLHERLDARPLLSGEELLQRIRFDYRCHDVMAEVHIGHLNDPAPRTAATESLHHAAASKAHLAVNIPDVVGKSDPGFTVLQRRWATPESVVEASAAHAEASMTSRTFRARSSGVNGF